MDPAPAAARANEWIDALRAQISKLAVRAEEDDVHRLRVACGRLGVWLRLAGIDVLRDDLRWLRRSAAPLRDLDVVGTMPEARRHSGRLYAERQRAERELALALESPRTAGLVRALPLLPAPDERRARRTLERLTKRARRAGEELAHADDPFAALHRLRRRVRALRYAREWLGEDTSALRAAQEELGAYNDRVVLLRTLRELVPTPAHDAQTAERLQRELERRARELCRQWADPRARLRVA